MGGVKTLLVPYFIYNIVLDLFYSIPDLITTYSLSIYLKNISNQIIGIICAWRFGHEYCCHLWFLLCLFWNKLIINCVIRFIRSPKWQDITVIICVVIGIIIKLVGIKQLPVCIDIALISMAFTYVGFRFKDFWMRRHRVKLILIAIVVYVLGVILNYRLSGNVQVGFFSGEFGMFSLFFLTALSGIFLIISISHWIGFHKIFSYLGRNSITIYVLHYVPVEIMWVVINKLCKIDQNNNLQAIVIGAIITIVVCVVMVPIVGFINKYFAWSIGKK